MAAIIMNGQRRLAAQASTTNHRRDAKKNGMRKKMVCMLFSFLASHLSTNGCIFSDSSSSSSPPLCSIIEYFPASTSSFFFAFPHSPHSSSSSLWLMFWGAGISSHSPAIAVALCAPDWRLKNTTDDRHVIKEERQISELNSQNGHGNGGTKNGEN